MKEWRAGRAQHVQSANLNANQQTSAREYGLKNTDKEHLAYVEYDGRIGKAERQSMTTLWLKFYFLLRDEIHGEYAPHGPLFCHWLPDSQKDAIKLALGNPHFDLSVWFDRYGFQDKDGWFQFDYDRREITEAALVSQRRHDAGPLAGILKISKVDPISLEAITTNKIGHEEYLNYAKLVVIDLMAPALSGFISNLRERFGQYWLKPLPIWDSTERSLGSYCRLLNLQWSTNNGEEWRNFVPDEPTAYSYGVLRLYDYDTYITKADWQLMTTESTEKFKPSRAMILLSRARKAVDTENFDMAFVDACTSLEIAISETLHSKFSEANQNIEQLNAFFQLRRSLQAALVTLCMGATSSQDLKLTQQAISIRNTIIHDGGEPPVESPAILEATFRVIANLIFSPGKYKLPRFSNQNSRIEKKRTGGANGTNDHTSRED